MDEHATQFDDVIITPEMTFFTRWKAGLVYAAKFCRFSAVVRPIKYTIMLPIDFIYGALVILSFGCVWAARPQLMTDVHDWLEILPLSTIYRRFFYILLLPFWCVACIFIGIAGCCVGCVAVDGEYAQHYTTKVCKAIWPLALDHNLTWKEQRKIIVQVAAPV